MPQARSPHNRTIQEINKDIEELEDDISNTEYHCNKTIENKKKEIKRFKDLTKKLSQKKSPQLKPVVSSKFDRMQKRLQERKDTLQLLRNMGEDTKVVEDEIKEIQEYLTQSHSIHSDNSTNYEYSSEDSMGDLPLLKVLFFDLDETILTSADPQLNVTRVRKELIKLGSVNIASRGRPPSMSDTITTKEIVKLLKYCTKRDDIKWFIISKGENKDKVGQLFANYVGEIYPDNDDFGVSMFNHNNKRKSIEKLLKKLDQSFYIPEAIFVDDKKNNTKSVSKISGVRVIDIPGEKFNVKWLPITLMTKDNCDECMRYLSGSRAASKRTQKKGKKKSINTKGKSKKGRSTKGRSKKGRSKKNK
jgi:HAD superfamily phosphatase (TIGR01681 family)